MPVTYEVMSVYNIEDRASGILTGIIERLEQLDALTTRVQEKFAAFGEGPGFARVTEAIGRIDQSLSGLATRADSTAASFRSSFDSAGAGILALTRQVDALVASLTVAGRAAAGIGGATAGGAGGGGFRGGGAFPMPAPTPGPRPITGGGPIPRPGPFVPRDDGISIPEAPGQWDRFAYHGGGAAPPRIPGYEEPAAKGGGAGGGAGALETLGLEVAGVFLGLQAMREERSLTQSLITMGYTPGTQAFAAAMQQMRSIAYTSHKGQIYSEPTIAEAFPGMTGVLSAVGGRTPEEKMALLAGIAPTAIRMGEVAKQEGLGALGPSTIAAFQFAHMAHHYTPETLGPDLDLLLNLSRVTHRTLPAEMGVLKYAVPLGEAAGMSPEDAAKWIGFMQVMGFSGTTAATGMGQIITGMTKTGGPLAGQLHARSAVTELEQELNLQPGEIGSGGRDNQHVEALRALGLINAQGKWSADVAPGGKLSFEPLMAHISSFRATHTPQETLTNIRNAFTVRGMREAAIMDPAALLRGLLFVSNVGQMPGAAATQAGLQSTTMQQMEQVWANVVTLGATLADPILPALNKSFQALNAGLNATTEFFKSHKSAAATVGGGAAGALLGLGVGFLAGGPAGAVAGAEIGAGAGAGAGFLALTPKWLTGQGLDAPLGGLDGGLAGPWIFGSSLTRPAPVTIAPQVSVTINGVDDAGWKARIEKFVGDLVHGLAQAMTHDTGTGDGSFYPPAFSGE